MRIEIYKLEILCFFLNISLSHQCHHHHVIVWEYHLTLMCHNILIQGRRK